MARAKDKRRSKDKQATDAPGPKGGPAAEPESLPESDIPDPETIVARIPFTSPTGRKFTIIRTNERDAYEKDDEPSQT
ncbi:MAG TPA: hypothetical protein VGC89_20440 [Pyrinomonadaceae bacterium]